MSVEQAAERTENTQANSERSSLSLNSIAEGLSNVWDRVQSQIGGAAAAALPELSISDQGQSASSKGDFEDLSKCPGKDGGKFDPDKKPNKDGGMKDWFKKDADGGQDLEDGADKQDVDYLSNKLAKEKELAGKKPADDSDDMRAIKKEKDAEQIRLKKEKAAAGNGWKKEEYFLPGKFKSVKPGL